MALVFQWFSQRGGIKVLEQRSAAKAKKCMKLTIIRMAVTAALFPLAFVAVSTPFRIQDGNENLEKQFVDEAKKRNMIQLKGH